MNKSKEESQTPSIIPKPDFHGAALIDKDGNEVPITEDMLEDAFEKLEKPDKKKTD